MYNVLNTLSEYTYSSISKKITSYTFLLVFKIIESLQRILNLKNVMKVFVYFGISMAKTSVSVDISRYCKLRKLTVVFNPSISNQISLIVISVDDSGGAGRKKMDSLASNNHC